MQTQSDPPQGGLPGEWVARTNTPSRSVFRNYVQARDSVEEPEPSAPVPSDSGLTLQESIDAAVARSYIHRHLAAVYQDPEMQSWNLSSSAVQLDCLVKAGSHLGFRDSAAALANELAAADFEDYRAAHFAVFGHAARGGCPLNEIEYGDVKADPLFQPHHLADLAAFYRAFGLDVAPDAGERQDHISMELEFMSVLTAKEAYAIEHQLDNDEQGTCRAAQKKFLREHLGRWTPAFCRRLTGAATHPLMQRLAEFTKIFVESECRRMGVNAGSQDMLLRPVDEAAESMCASCGLGQLPPGAAEPVAP